MMKYLLLLGRLFFSAIFILGGLSHFSSESVRYAASEGVPFAAILVPLSGILALLGGLSVLLGYKTRWGAWLLVIFLLPVTLMMHKFWEVTDPILAANQQAHFLKNIALLGGSLILAYFGSGPYSIDHRKHERG